MYRTYKKDVLLILGILLLALLLWGGFRLFSRDGGEQTALVTVDGKTVLSVPLTGTDNKQFDLNESFGVDVILEKQGESIRFIHSDCPDQICLGFGAIAREPERAVCLPNRVAITLIQKG